MSKEKKPSFTLNTVDDFFTTEEMREDAKLKRINEIDLDLIDPFPDHPYKVKDDEDMYNLMESIKDVGIITPAVVRKKEDGRYELISGHRRKRACEMLGFETLRCEIVDLSRDEATILMCDSNMYRSKILPSEKAKSYKMKLDAMKRQAGRPGKENVSPVGTNLRSDEILAKEVGDSRNQIHRYIRLTELIPELLDKVDEGEIAMRPAVEISYLPKDLQEALLYAIEYEQCTPSHDQALRMRRMLRQEVLTPESILAVMQEEKPNQKEKYTLRKERVDKLIPKEVPATKREEYILEALDYYGRYRKRQAREQER